MSLRPPTDTPSITPLPLGEGKGEGLPTEHWARDELERIDAAGHRRVLEPLDSPQGAEVQAGGRTWLNFSSNDYLGLAASESVRAARPR
jgi:8-amino-7-oxononanoate synthase